MANEIIKYHNDFNNLALKNFNAKELDLLMSLFVIAKNQESNTITLTFQQLRAISKYKPTANSRFVKDLERTNDKLLNLKFKAISEDKSVISQFVLFTIFDIFLDDEIVKIAVNERFKWILNSLTSQFTRFELEEFVNLKSQYSKTCYKCLKQFRITGCWCIEIDKFRELMDVPKSYGLCDVNKRVLTPIREELSSIFPKLQIKKQIRGRGGKVVGLEFSWQAEQVPQHDERVNSQKKKKQDSRKEYMQSGKSYSKKDLFDVFE